MAALSRTAILTVAAALLLGANLLIASAVGGVFDSAEVEQAPAKAAPEALPIEAPAYGIAAKIINQGLPDEMDPKAPAEPGVVDILALGCGADTAETASLGYQRTVQIGGKTAVAAVEVWPTGYGAAAVQQYLERSSQCLGDTVSVWSDKRRVADFPAVAAGVDAGGSGAQTLRWSVGDITLSLTGPISTKNTEAAQAWTQSAERLMTPECADLHPNVSDAKRSPWHSPNDYTGLLDKTPVKINRPVVTIAVPTKKPRLETHELVERPTPPAGVPIWPASLPPAVTSPNRPDRPREPDLSELVSYQIPDSVGPGCGWAFNTSPTIAFSQEESDQDRSKVVDAARARMAAAATDWAANETKWRTEMDSYYRKAAKYRVYASEVQEVARAWDKIRSSWAWYQTQQAQREAAIADRKSWVAARAEAELQWATNQCAPGELPTPAIPAPVPPGAPTPKPTPTCLAQSPEILIETQPTVPPEPVPPADPRPASAR
jgi:hypothetical protein